MGGDEELRALRGELLDAGERRQLAVRGERGLGLVEQVEAARTEAVREQVDLPDPFSPTRNVTPGPNSSRRPRRAATTGSANG
ncbi:hypothetical protein ACL02T_08125 [Pseudonocardia sp. RS010]|uniref:hypothetical protein n=1 Tax=Pseudonocardia sp. RS010 TaxID=3385979 RepID=UPI0039A0BC41